MRAKNGGHACFFRGGMHGFLDVIRSMSGRYASYWNAFLLDGARTVILTISVSREWRVNGRYCHLNRNSLLLGSLTNICTRECSVQTIPNLRAY